MMILVAGLGMVSGMIIGTKKLHPAIFISDLLISSAILIWGLKLLGILDLAFTCPTMDNPLFSNPVFFLELIISSAFISTAVFVVLSIIVKFIVNTSET